MVSRGLIYAACLSICVIPVLGAKSVLAQILTLSGIFEEARASIEQAERLDGSLSRPLDFAELQNSFRYLERVLRSARLGERELREYYILVLAYLELFDQSRLSRPETARLITSEIASTAEAVRRTGTFGLNPGARSRTLVNVEVETSRGQERIMDLRVGATPRLLVRSDRPPLYLFTLPTSPSIGSVPPGRYRFVVLRGDAVIIEYDADVGLSGSLNDINLRIPLP